MDSPIIRLADYRAPLFRVQAIELDFDLDPDRTEVRARISLAPEAAMLGAPLRLDGKDLQLRSIALDGAELASHRYQHDTEGLSLIGISAPCVLETVVEICPAVNTRLEGLYCSGPMLLTQCEAEGFRRITFFPDRPDVMTRFTVTLRADRSRFPVLLSNGNPVDAGDLEGGRHWARWIDPHPKPSYLFALVAGDLDCLSENFRTATERDVRVNVWAERRDVPRCQHALAAAVAAMRWDQTRFGRVYDLDVFNIVAVQDFTMGAMENKGLNIFNARYILADAPSATDTDFASIESVIGHEYFHNWSGNRVTLRDWFQLSLKEGLTVFRDQEFTADRHSRGLKRIEDVRALRGRQFVEDSGPLSHPVRPVEYREVSNFYTSTVYEKGAEVVRMLHTLIGDVVFRRGMDLYFERNDGRAATVEDFLTAMAEVSGRDLGQFKRWYEQPGTPELVVRETWNPAAGAYALEIEQRRRAADSPLHVPLALRLYAKDGSRLPPPQKSDARNESGVFELRQAVHRLDWQNLAERPLPAFLQALSAPVRLAFDYGPAELARLVAIEADPLTRWDAMQRLATLAIASADHVAAASAAAALVDAAGVLLNDIVDPAFVAEALTLPDLPTLADGLQHVDLDTLIRGREDLLDLIAETHTDRLSDRYTELAAIEPGALTPAAIAARRLKSVCLELLTRLDPLADAANKQFAHETVMTDRLAALRCLLHFEAPGAQSALDEFRERWRFDPLVTDKWLSLVATVPVPETLERIAELLRGELWQPRNPNRVRAILGSLARNNLIAMHRRDGAGYALLFEQIELIDAINPQIAARLLTALEFWRRLDAVRAQHIDRGLRVLEVRPLSRDLNETVLRMLE